MATRNWSGTTSGDWSVSTNWLEGVVPASTDTVFFKNNAVSVTTGLAQSAVTLASLTIDSTYTGTIGSGSTYLAIGATAITIGGASGSSTSGNGSGRILLNLGTVQFTATVLSTSGTSSDSGLEPVRLLGTNASNKLYVLGGRVGVATTVTTEISTLTEWNVSGTGAVLNLGSGCTLTTGNQTGSSAVTVNSALTTLTQSVGGTTTTLGTGTITTANIGGTIISSSTGTITTLNLYANATGDFTGNIAARTVTTLNQYAGAKLMRYAANPSHLTVTTHNLIQGGTLTLS